MINIYLEKDELPASCSACAFCKHMAWCSARRVAFGRKDDWLFERRATWCPLGRAESDEAPDPED